MINKLNLQVQGSEQKIDLVVKSIFNAGYAGKDQKLVQEHIDELAKLGVPVPNTTPTLYPLSDYLATTSDSIQVQHGETSGEIEYCLIWDGEDIYVTVASDHTDRNLETFSVPKSKQACPNIIASEVWRYSEVKDHWDELELECWITKDGKRELYQKEKLAALMSPEEWKDIFTKKGIGEAGHMFFSGTINTVNQNLIFGDFYEIKLKDPVLERNIECSYQVNILPEAIE